MLFGKIFYMIHRTISVRFLRDTIRRQELRAPSSEPQKRKFLRDITNGLTARSKIELSIVIHIFFDWEYWWDFVYSIFIFLYRIIENATFGRFFKCSMILNWMRFARFKIRQFKNKANLP